MDIYDDTAPTCDITSTYKKHCSYNDQCEKHKYQIKGKVYDKYPGEEPVNLSLIILIEHLKLYIKLYNYIKTIKKFMYTKIK